MTTYDTTRFPQVNDCDFVSTDAAALASHMNDCANSRGRFFGLQTAFESAHSMLFPRLGTAAALVVIVFGIVSVI